MNILLTNDDGYEAPGIHALYNAAKHLGTIHIVAPQRECSACSHTVTMRKTVKVQRRRLEHLGHVHAVDGTPADCVRLAISKLIHQPIHLVLSGINNGANTGVDVFYSGTIAGAREAAIMNIPAIALSQALRPGIDTNWDAVSHAVRLVVEQLQSATLPGPGFWSVNLPAPTPQRPHEVIHHVPLEPVPAEMQYSHVEGQDENTVEFANGSSYWTREANTVTDFTVVRDGGIAVSAVPLYGRF